MRVKLMPIILILGLYTDIFAQQDTTWNKWNWLVGEWIGEGSGQLGSGSGTFSFNFDLDKKILVRKSHSEYPAKDNNPKIIHDDLMIVYLDYSGIPSKANYYDNEGHTINYLITISDKSIIFTSEKLTNVPIFRLTYTLLENEIVNTKFEIAQDGVNFINYIWLTFFLFPKFFYLHLLFLFCPYILVAFYNQGI